MEKIIFFFLVLLFGSLPLSIAATQISLGFLLLLALYQYGILKRPFIFTHLDKPILVFLIFGLVSCLFGNKPISSFTDYIESNWFISLYLIVVNFTDNRKKTIILLYIMFSIGALNGLYGIIQHFLGGIDLFRQSGNEIILRFGDQVRATGTFSIYMTFGGQMVLLLLFGTGLILCWPNKTFLLFLITTSPFIFGGLLFSFVRSAWLGFIGGVFFITLLKGKKTFFLIACPLLVFIFSILIFYSPLRERAVSILNTQTDHSNLERIHIWKTSIDMIKDYPLLGIGGGIFKEVMGNYQKPPQAKSFTHAHNNLLQITVEYGLIGLSLYLYIWYVFFREGIRAFKTTPDPFSKGIILGGIGALAGFHIAGLFEYNFGDAEVAMMMWALVGFTLAGRKGHFVAKKNHQNF